MQKYFKQIDHSTISSDPSIKVWTLTWVQVITWVGVCFPSHVLLLTVNDTETLSGWDTWSIVHFLGLFQGLNILL